MSPIEELEKRLRGLLKGKHTSLTLDFNESHASNYATAKEWDERGHYDKDDWASPAEERRALETNSVWTLHYYPETPVGFTLVRASSLVAILEYVEWVQQE